MTAIGETDPPEDGEIPMQADAGKSESPKIFIEESIMEDHSAGLADFSMLPSALPVADGPPITGTPTTGEEYLRQVR